MKHKLVLHEGGDAAIDLLRRIISPKAIDQILAHRDGISKIASLMRAALGLLCIERSLESENTAGLLNSIDALISSGRDGELMTQSQGSALKCLRFFSKSFLTDQEDVAIAGGVNKALCIFPLYRDNNNHFQKEFDTIAEKLIEACISKINSMRKKKSTNLKFYNGLYFIFHNCIVRTIPDTVKTIAQGHKNLKVSRKITVQDLYEWCREIGFDEHQCHDVDVVINGCGRMGEEKVIKNAVAREKRRQGRIQAKIPKTIDVGGSEEVATF